MTWQETGYLLMLFNGSLSAGDLVAENPVLSAATVIIQQYAFNCLKNTGWCKGCTGVASGITPALLHRTPDHLSDVERL
jgi:hypothetical protein